MADGRSNRTKSIAASIASVEDPALQLGPILRGILQHNDQIVEQNQAILQLLNYHVNALPPVPPLPPNANVEEPAGVPDKNARPEAAQQQATIKSADQIAESFGLTTQAVSDEERIRVQVENIWDGVVLVHSRESPRFERDFHRWNRPATLRGVFLGKHEWTSKSFAWAYPDLVVFLHADQLPRRCHSQVVVKDYTQVESLPCSSAYSEARPRIGILRDRKTPLQSGDGLRRRVRGTNANDPFACALLWDALDSDRSRQSTQTLLNEAIRMRSINILDLSPKVLTCLLASTPRVDLSYMAAFIQRHLTSSNWGKATRLRFGDSMSSYTLEYHFAFYYVTPKRFEHGSVRPDVRQLRKSAPFGREAVSKSRYIHEESLSFLLIGHFKDVATCVQLSETYFKYDPYHVNDPIASQPSTFRPLNPSEPPALLLLNWISVALHHVLWRWQSAIEAVHAEIKTSRQIVFMHDRNDLMADDPQFSLSKTYFWALQAYKLFEDTINETIATWDKFRETSLPGLRDRRIAQEEWERGVQDIEDAVAELQKKVSTIRKRVEEVKDLRRGLISASALFDSRTSVRQGENIRLLTYITILFFPLSFATSIFGMQIVGDSRTAVHAFAAVLPAITVATAFFVSNLQNFVDGWDAFSESISTRLRRKMKRYPREKWKYRALNLQHDLAANKAPVRKAKRSTSAWMYLLFVIEYLIVGLPVSELKFAFGCLTGASRSEHSPSNTEKEEDEKALYDESNQPDTSMRSRINDSLREEKNRQRWERRKRLGIVLLTLAEVFEAVPSALAKFFKLLGACIRFALVPIWLAFITVDFFVLLVIFIVVGIFTPSRRGAANGTTKRPLPIGPRHRAFYALGLNSLVEPASPKKEWSQPSHNYRADHVHSHTRQHISRAATQATLNATSHPATPTSKSFDSILGSSPIKTQRSGPQSTTDSPPPSSPITSVKVTSPYATRMASLASPSPLSLGGPLNSSPPTIRVSQIPRPLANQPEPRPDTLLSETGASIMSHPGRSTMEFIEELSKTGTSMPRPPLLQTLPSRGSSRRPSSPTMPTNFPPGKWQPPAPRREPPAPPRVTKPVTVPASPVESSFSVSRPGTTTADFSPDFPPSLPAIHVDRPMVSPVSSHHQFGGPPGRRSSVGSSDRPVSPLEPSSPSSVGTVMTLTRLDSAGNTAPRHPVSQLGRNLEARAVSVASQRGESIEVLELTKPPKPPPKQ